MRRRRPRTRALRLSSAVIACLLSSGFLFAQQATADASAAGNNPSVAASASATTPPDGGAPSSTATHTDGGAEPSGTTAGEIVSTSSASPAIDSPSGSPADGPLQSTPSQTPTTPTTSPTPSTVPSTTRLRAAIDAFVFRLVGSIASAASPSAVEHGMSGINDSHFGAALRCRCTVAVALSVDGDSYAVAAPVRSRVAGTPSIATGATTTVAANKGQAAAGSTGDAVSVSLSESGSADAESGSGSVGGANVIGVAQSVQASTVHEHPAAALPLGDPLRQILASVPDAGASIASVVGSPPCAPSDCVPSGVVSVDVATVRDAAADGPTVGGVGSCWTADVAGSSSGNLPRCSIAVALAVRGTARAAISAVDAAPQAIPCNATTAGASTAISMAVRGSARALARSGRPFCSPKGVSDQTAATTLASSGSTGASLGVAATAAGTADSRSISGNSGRVQAKSDSPSGDVKDSSTATTGSTGDAVGIAIGKHGASAQVQSGNSGEADALCTGCAAALVQNSGSVVATASSGSTGTSYSLAVAGQHAIVHAASGDSGRSLAWSFDGTGRASPAHSASHSASQGGGGRVLVVGRSGNTGSTVIVGIDVSSQVDVWSTTGHSGFVLSQATWAPSGCRLEVRTLRAVCSGTQPSQVGHPGRSAGGGNGLLPPGVTVTLGDPLGVSLGLRAGAFTSPATPGSPDSISTGLKTRARHVDAHGLVSPILKAEPRPLAGEGRSLSRRDAHESFSILLILGLTLALGSGAFFARRMGRPNP